MFVHGGEVGGGGGGRGGGGTGVWVVGLCRGTGGAALEVV